MYIHIHIATVLYTVRNFKIAPYFAYRHMIRMCVCVCVCKPCLCYALRSGRTGSVQRTLAVLALRITFISQAFPFSLSRLDECMLTNTDRKNTTSNLTRNALRGVKSKKGSSIWCIDMMRFERILVKRTMFERVLYRLQKFCRSRNINKSF